MSWDAYTQALVADANVDGAVIVGFPDGGLWASTNLALQGTEGATMATRFSSPRSGVKLEAGGVKYMATNCTEDFLTGKQGQGGLCVTKSGKAVIFVSYVDGMNAGSALNAASNMAADLVSKGF